MIKHLFVAAQVERTKNNITPAFAGLSCFIVGLWQVLCYITRADRKERQNTEGGAWVMAAGLELKERKGEVFLYYP